ncbi:MAG: hypothetical protein J0H15_13955 [Xanthomonadales bacterium]|nr:hypothetical protein [Xanthomonadales bacterium]
MRATVVATQAPLTRDDGTPLDRTLATEPAASKGRHNGFLVELGLASLP